ncbi:hypothetical protein BQ8482_111638 [Mesorhizobium delmotii]|uniref:Uncharacterized protein n=1 Tax=Mesorhizobium delmotii TaxID=1631247 RepID=A0A2P9AF18_9HYPH|nr:hypothetical protein BQ8482_111638 [Mesorhizobium delmotii]
MRRHAIIESIVDTSVELIQIHSLEAIFEALVLRLTTYASSWLRRPIVSTATSRIG